MNIDFNASRLLGTIAIWAATAAIFVFGFFRANVSGFAVYLWGIIGLALATGPSIATIVIWSAKPLNSSNTAKAPDLTDTHA